MKPVYLGGAINAPTVQQYLSEKKYNSTISNQSLVQNVGLSPGTTTSDVSSQIDAVGSASVDRATIQSLRERIAKEERIGVKDDQGKLRFDLLPWKALEGLAKVLTFGAKKYSPNGWRTVPDAKARYLAAMLRHLCAMNVGEHLDPESGLRHIDHLLTNAAFLSELMDEKKS